MRPFTPIEVRFWQKVHKTESCWIWTASCNSRGYGVLGLPGHRGGTEYAHRISYQLHYGDIPPDYEVIHCCDNPKCVNPSHLNLGTHKENMLDCLSKRRIANCERHGRHRFTESQIRLIRDDTRSNIEIASHYKTNPTYISAIKHRSTWKSLL